MMGMEVLLLHIYDTQGRVHLPVRSPDHAREQHSDMLPNTFVQHSSEKETS